MSAHDTVNNPKHYANSSNGIECIDAITAAVSGKSGIEAVCVANVIKYVWRYELKNGLEDVKKAQWYLNRLVSELEGKPDSKHYACDHIYGLYLNGESRCVKCGVMQ